MARAARQLWPILLLVLGCRVLRKGRASPVSSSRAADAAPSQVDAGVDDEPDPALAEVEYLGPALERLVASDSHVYFRTNEGIARMPFDATSGGSSRAWVPAYPAPHDYVVSSGKTRTGTLSWSYRYPLEDPSKTGVATFPWDGRFLIGPEYAYFADHYGCDGLWRIDRSKEAAPERWIASDVVPCSNREVALELRGGTLYAIMDEEFRFARENERRWTHVQRAKSFALDDVFAYLVVFGPPTSPCASGSILRVTLDLRDTEEWLLRDGALRCGLHSLVVDDVYLYWRQSDGTVWRMAKAGGKPHEVVGTLDERHVPCLPGPHEELGLCTKPTNIVLGGGYLFWIEPGEQRLYRVRLHP